MARRKRQLLEDDDTDSDVSDAGDDFDGSYDANDPDARAERELFENPYAHKRRRKNGKEDAIYGVFADSDEDEGFSKTKNGRAAKRSDWTKAPSFVTGDKVELDKSMDVDETMAEEEGDEDADEGENDGKVDEDNAEEDSSDGGDEEEDFAGPASRPSLGATPVVEPEEEEQIGRAHV